MIFEPSSVAEAEALGDLLVTLEYHGFFPDDADVTAENLVKKQVFFKDF